VHHQTEDQGLIDASTGSAVPSSKWMNAGSFGTSLSSGVVFSTSLGAAPIVREISRQAQFVLH
jgi:hypothetical protein